MSIKNLLRLHEGLRLNPYHCTANKLTIGYGRNLEDTGITEKEAEFLLANDIFLVEHDLKDRLSFFSELSDVRRAVLVDMAFNLGVSGLFKFKKTLALIKSGDYNEAAMEMLDSRWANQVGKRSIRLAEMMRTDEWPREIREDENNINQPVP